MKRNKAPGVGLIRRRHALAESLESRVLLAAQILYVDQATGTDSGGGASPPGSTLTSAFKTIQEAANEATRLSPTQASPVVVEIRAGVYREMVSVTCPWVTFENYNGEAVTVSGLDQVSSPFTSNGSDIWTASLPAASDYSASTDAQVLGPSASTITDQVFNNSVMVSPTRFPQTIAPQNNDVGNTYQYAQQSAVSLLELPDQSPFRQVISATESGNTATITTSAPDGLSLGQYVTISGVGVSGYNGSFPVASILSPTMFTVTNLPKGLAASGGAGATARPADSSTAQSATFYDPDLWSLLGAIDGSTPAHDAASISQLSAALVGATVHINPGGAGYGPDSPDTWVWETFTISAVTSSGSGSNLVPGITYTIPTSSVLARGSTYPQMGDFYYLSNFTLPAQTALNLGVQNESVLGLDSQGGATSKVVQTADSYVVDTSTDPSQAATSQSGSLYLHLYSTTNPNTQTIEVKTRDVAFDLSGEANVTVQGITLMAATIASDVNSTSDTISNVHAQFLSSYDRVGTPLNIRRDGALPNVVEQGAAAAATTAQTLLSTETTVSYGWLQFVSGIELMGVGDQILNSTINSSAGSGVTIGAAGVTVQGCNITNTDTMGSDDAPIVTLAPSWGIQNADIISANGGTVTAQITVAASASSSIAVGDLVYIGNIEYSTPSVSGTYGGVYSGVAAGSGTFAVTSVSVSGGSLTFTYNAAVGAQNAMYIADSRTVRYNTCGVVEPIISDPAAGVISVIQIQNNDIEQAGRSDVVYRAADEVDIVGNTLAWAGLNALDLGATYAWGEDTSTPTSNSHILISGNTIHDIINGVGVYADNNNSGVTIQNNIIYNVAQGIVINVPAESYTIEGNTIEPNGRYASIAPALGYTQPFSINFFSSGSSGTNTVTSNIYTVSPTNFGQGATFANNTQVTAYSSNDGGAQIILPADSAPTPDATIEMPTSGAAYMYEDFGAAFHATDVQIAFGDEPSTSFYILSTNNPNSWPAPPSTFQSGKANSTVDIPVDLTGRYIGVFFTAASSGQSAIQVAHLIVVGLAAAAVQTTDPTVIAPSAAAALQSNLPGAVTLQTNGNLLVADAAGSLTEYYSNGLLDQAFGPGGVIQIPGAGSSPIVALAATSNGSILVGLSLGSAQAELLRYRSNGKLDKTFGLHGIVRVAFSLSSITTLRNGSILLWGNAANSSTALELEELLISGKVNASFGNGGATLTTFPDLGAGTTASSITLLNSGDILATAVQIDQNPSDGLPVASERVVAARYLSNGQLDSAYGASGIYDFPTVDVSGSSQTPFGVVASTAVGADGSIVAAYDGSDNDASSQPLTLYRALPAGLFDTSFGVSGVVTLASAPIGGGSRVVIEPNGEYAVVSSDHSNLSITLLSTTGAVDTQYGPAGTGLAQSLSRPLVASNAIEQANDLVVVGQSAGGGYALVRYTAGGNVDASFAYYGASVNPTGISGAAAASVELKNKKTIVAGSELAPAAAQPTEAALVRYNSNGTLDTTFGQGGRVFVQLGNSATFTAAALESNGNILVAATGDDGASAANPVYVIYCFTANGRLNAHFGNGGRVAATGPITSLAGLKNGLALAVASSLDASGSPTGVVVSRYTSRGQLDPKFGSAGSVSLSAIGQAGNLIVEPNGQLLIGANSGVARLNANGTLDTTFGSQGLASTAVPTADGSETAVASALALTPSGDIMVAMNGPDQTAAVARYLPNGQLDSTFASAGVLWLGASSATVYGDLSVRSIQSIFVRSNGGVLFGVDASNGASLSGGLSSAAGVVAVSSQGVDTSYGSGGLMLLGASALDVGNSVPALVTSSGIVLAVANAPVFDAFAVAPGVHRVA